MRNPTLGFLRLVLTLHLVAVLAQPVLAGLFLTGDVDAIVVHGIVGVVVLLLGWTAGGAVVLHVLAHRRAYWLVPAAALLGFAEAVQVGMGYARILQVHVPLGVAVVTVSVLLAGWVWTPAAGGPR